jgi:hypothetical protein
LAVKLQKLPQHLPWRIRQQILWRNGQLQKSAAELEAENRNIESSLLQMRKTPKNKKLIAKLNQTLQVNKQILQSRTNLYGK